MNNDKLLPGYKIILGYLGLFLIVIGIVNLLPIAIMPFFPHEWNDIWRFLLPGLGSVALGIGQYQFIRGKENITTLKNQDAIIVTFSWILAIFIGAIPYMFEYSFTKSVFESASALTTTGFTILNLGTLSSTLTFHRVLLTLIGGIGIILIMLVFLRDKRGMRLYSSEGHNDKLLPNLINSSKAIFKIYIGYILGGVFLYMLLGMNWLDAFCHSVNAVGTSGFSNKVGGIGYYNSISIEIVTIILMILGSINFLVQFMLIKGKWKNFFKYCETKAMGIIYGFAFVVVAFLLFKSTSLTLPQSFRSAIFHSVSALTATGYSTMNTNFATLSAPIILIFILLMFSGGGAGSAAGGIKVYRIHIMIKDFFWNIKDKFINKNVVSLHFVRKAEETEAVSDEERSSVKTFILLYVMITVILAFAISLYGYGLTESIFEMTSAMGNVGLSMGVITPLVPNGVYWITILAMVLGRLEIIVVLMAFVQMGKKVKDAFQKIKN